MSAALVGRNQSSGEHRAVELHRHLLPSQHECLSVAHDVIFQVEAGDVADAAVDDSTVQSNAGDDMCDADCLGLSDSVCVVLMN